MTELLSDGLFTRSIYFLIHVIVLTNRFSDVCEEPFLSPVTQTGSLDNSNDAWVSRILENCLQNKTHGDQLHFGPYTKV